MRKIACAQRRHAGHDLTTLTDRLNVGDCGIDGDDVTHDDLRCVSAQCERDVGQVFNLSELEKILVQGQVGNLSYCTLPSLWAAGNRKQRTCAPKDPRQRRQTYL